MKKFLFILGVLFWGTMAWGQPVPTGPASWYDGSTGKTSRALGLGGAPILNYQKDDGTWGFIVDDWVQVGQKKVWKSVRGNHRAFADSTGAAIYAVGNHYLGTKTTHLIKFDKSDSTWVTLKASVPDSVRIHGGTITFHDIFPGVDKSLRNNAKVFRTYNERFTFHQEARDSLATWGPWAGKLLGTATKLTTDSLNLTLRDIIGAFDINVTGRMVDEWVRLEDGDVPVFHMTAAHLYVNDSLVESIPVRKFIVKYAGSPWLIELFNPIDADALPAGDIWHNGTFGHDTGFDGLYWIPANQWVGSTARPTGSGTADSISVYFEDAGSGAVDARASIYTYDYTEANMVQVDTSAELSVDVTNFEWRTFVLQNDGTIIYGMKYVLFCWGGTNMHKMQYQSDAGSVDTIVVNESETYSGGAWDDPPDLLHDYKPYNMPIYCWYTEEVSGHGVDMWKRLTTANADTSCGDSTIFNPKLWSEAVGGTEYWCHGEGETEHYGTIDLGASYDIVKIRGRSYLDADPTDVDIYIAPDGVAWGDPVALNITTWQDRNSWSVVDTYNKTGQHIRIDVINTENGDNVVKFGDSSPTDKVVDVMYTYQHAFGHGDYEGTAFDCEGHAAGASYLADSTGTVDSLNFLINTTAVFVDSTFTMKAAIYSRSSTWDLLATSDERVVSVTTLDDKEETYLAFTFTGTVNITAGNRYGIVVIGNDTCGTNAIFTYYSTSVGSAPDNDSLLYDANIDYWDFPLDPLVPDLKQNKLVSCWVARTVGAPPAPGGQVIIIGQKPEEYLDTCRACLAPRDSLIWARGISNIH